MSEAALIPPIKRPGRFHFRWIPAVLFTPRKAFAAIVSSHRGKWLTPLTVLSISGLLAASVAGPIKQQIAQMGGLPLPPDFQYWGPDQQAQFMQAAQATQNPVFFYVFPALIALVSVWIGWLLVSGLLHFTQTLLGGRGSSTTSLNLVAWSALPLALRDLVRIGSMLVTRRLIETPGLAGFAPEGEGFALYLASLLALLDIYIVWHLVLLIIGVRQANGISVRKAFGGVFFTLLVVLAIQASLAYLVGLFSNLSITRPFFF
jgi:hypothetical protein